MSATPSSTRHVAKVPFIDRPPTGSVAGGIPDPANPPSRPTGAGARGFRPDVAAIGLGALAFLLAGAPLAAADWPSFRGPAGQGVALDTRAPVHWNARSNILWQAPLPRPGNGSPIVSAGRVFVTSAGDVGGLRRSLFCFDASTGRLLWERTARVDRKMPTHETNPYGGTTPASDGRRVVVWHATAGLHCYDHDGRELWSRDLGEFRHMWGYGSSPILHNNRVILHSGPGAREFLAAFDLATGRTLWETEEPLDGGPDRNKAGQYMGSWSTPVLATVDGREQFILMLPTRVNGYDAATGAIVWSCDGLRHSRGDLAYAAPVLVGDLCFVTGGYNGAAMAFRLGGTGNITASNRLWRVERQPQSIGSGVAVDGLVYRPNAGPSTIECIDPATGRVLWNERSPAGDHWASIIRVGGLLYATGQSGTTVVFRPNHTKLDVVATNPLPGKCNATPAAAGGRLYFRSDSGLFCVGE